MNDIVGEILKRILISKQDIVDSVSTGRGVDSFDKYQKLVGKHEGLQLALDLINGILTENDKDDAE